MHSAIAAPVLQIEVELPVLEALVKTVGIAIQNLMSKASKVGHTTPMGRAANAEMQTLITAQQELLSALQKAG